MKAAELRDMAGEELLAKEQELRKELFNLRFQVATGEIENPSRLGVVKKEIARVLTIMNEKRRAGQQGGEEKDA